MSKIIAKDQWEIKYLRESVWMPFGSMCNLIGQALAGKELTSGTFDMYAKQAFELAMEFTEKAFERVGQEEEQKDLPTT